MLFQRFGNFLVQFVGQFGVVGYEALNGIAALSQARFAVAEPRAALLDDAQVYAQVYDFTFAGDAGAECDFELGLAEGRGHLVLHHLHSHLVADGGVAVLDGGDAAYVEAHGGVELEGVTAGGGFGVAKGDANLLAQLVDEDARGVGLADGRGEFAQRLAHKAGLQTYFVVAHVALDFGLGGERGYGVNDDDVDG